MTDPAADREKLVQSKGSRVDGTCEWIKVNKLYDSWLRSSSQLLWLSGGPGKGKTMLSIFLAEELERTVELSSNALLLQYFCDNKDDKRNKSVAIIRGLISQLLKARRELCAHIPPTFKVQQEHLFTDPSFETLWMIFETMIRDSSLGDIYCIVDGLDECDEALSEVLLKKLKTLFSSKFTQSSACHFKLIIVSRDLPDFISDQLSSFPRIRLDPDADHEVNNDIHRFIEAKIDELSALRQYPKSLRTHVKGIFESRAQGTFLWVGIVAKELTKYKATEVEKALELFPSGLEDLYARMLLLIDEDRRDNAAKILRWVVMAVRPLTLSELSEVIGITRSSIAFNPDDKMKDQVSCCGHFLTIKGNEVALIHQSAKDYLLRKTRDANPVLELFRVKEEMSNSEIARKCFDYLQGGALVDGPVDLKKDIARLEAFPLLAYAVLYWPEHARSLARSNDIFNLAHQFYSKSSPTRYAWWETYRNAQIYSKETHLSFSLLHIASIIDLAPLVENLLFKQKRWINRLKLPIYPIYVNKRDWKENTPLHHAASLGNEAAVQLLLQKGADMKARNIYKHTALRNAAMFEHEVVLQLLLKNGANIETKSNNESSLIWAASEGYERIVRLLLEKGANIETKDRKERTALIAAAHRGNEEMVRLLLEKDADIEAKYKFKKTALIWTARWGKEEVVRLLLEKGANTEAKDELERTALLLAAYWGREEVVRLLLEKGANIEAKDNLERTALIVAAERGNEEVVRLLLEKGANIEAKDGEERTALSWAESNNHTAVVSLLREKGAGDSNVK